MSSTPSRSPSSIPSPSSSPIVSSPSPSIIPRTVKPNNSTPSTISSSKHSPSSSPTPSKTPTSSSIPTSSFTPTSSCSPSTSTIPKPVQEHPIVVDSEEEEPQERDSLRDSIDKTHQQRMQHKQSRGGHQVDSHIKNRNPPRDTQRIHHERQGRDGYQPEVVNQSNSVRTEMVPQKTESKPNKIVASVVVLACNRPGYLRRSLDSIFKYHTGDVADKFPIIVSQDCGQTEVTNLINNYKDRIYKHIQHLDLTPIDGYGAIARHYKWALGQVFDEMKFDYVILVEEDLDIAVDFFEYFEALQPIFHMDPTLWCISAWNDNGMQDFVRNPEALFRTDWFPGLGWMLQRSLWDELKGKWPARYWDDWLRKPEQRQNRVCIRPEISRTFTFGEIGVSHGQFYSEYLARIQLNSVYVPFTEVNITYLQQDHFDFEWVKKIDRATLQSDNTIGLTTGDIKYVYSNWEEFQQLASMFGIMTDHLEGVPRGSYMGVVTFWYNRQKVYLVPANFEETHAHQTIPHRK